MTQLSNLLNFRYLLFHRNVEKLRNNPKSYSCGIQDNKHRKSFYFKSRTTKVTTVIDVSWVFRNCWVWCADEIVWSSALRERDSWEKDDKKLIKKRTDFSYLNNDPDKAIVVIYRVCSIQTFKYNYSVHMRAGVLKKNLIKSTIAEENKIYG